MSDSRNEATLQAIAVELRYIKEGLDEVKKEVGDFRSDITEVKVKVSSHAAFFGLLGGFLSMAGNALTKKFFGNP